jgi:hypothetical protein
MKSGILSSIGRRKEPVNLGDANIAALQSGMREMGTGFPPRTTL